LLRQVVVHHREHRLLQLTGVARPADEDHAPREVQDDERPAARAVLRRVGLELGRVQYREVRIKRRELRRLRADEHVPHERHVPRTWRQVAHRQPVPRVGAAIEVLHEELVALVEICTDVGKECFELLLGQRLVHLPPIDVLLRPGFFDDKLVVRRSTGVRRGDGDEGAHRGQVTFAAPDRRLDQHRSGEIPVHLAGRLESLRLEPDVAPNLRGVLARLRLNAHRV
jgi:hypothetical protein